MKLAGRDLTVAAFLLPGALTVFLSFNAGGFFPGSTAVAVVVLLAVLLARGVLGERPWEGVSGPLLMAAGGLGLFAVWTLVSEAWSHAPARAFIESDRALLYLLALVVFGTFLHGSRRMRWGVAAAAAGIVVVCIAGFASRTLPDLWAIAPNIKSERLSYPLTYWNALGLLAACGLTLCFHLASSDREPRAARVLGASAVPLLAATLLLTFSRGAIAAGAGGLLVYALLAHPRGLPAGLVSTVPASVIAVSTAYGADLLAKPNPTGFGAIEQGHRLAVTVGLCVVGSTLARLALLPLDDALARVRLRPGLRRTLLTATGLGLGVVLVLGALAGRGQLELQYHRFLRGDAITATDDVRSRLGNPGNNHRIDHWKVAVRAFQDAPLKGNGAGTYQILWARHRPAEFPATDGHSLYLEVLGELGVVGLALLAIPMLTLLAALAARARGPDRGPYAALFAAGTAWAVHAGLDWDWEVPATGLWLFALGGAALATSRVPSGSRRTGAIPRVAVAVGCLAMAVFPVRIGLSQLRLNQSVDAFRRNDCAATIRSALAARSVLAVRPEPYEMLAYCDARLDEEGAGVRMMRDAVARDPDSWELRYGLALTRATAGMDPRRAARDARRLNPLNPLTRAAVEQFSGGRPAAWAKWARRAELPLQ